MSTKHVMIAILLIFAGSAVIAFPLEEANAEPSYSTLEVGSGKTYSTIQSAIDAASSGDMIRIYSGTYYENVIVDKTLKIIGEGPDSTIIDAGGSSCAMIVEADNCRIEGLAFTGSGGEDFEGPTNAGLRFDSDNNIALNCTAYDNFMGILLSWGDYNKLVYSEAYENEIHGIGLGRYSTIQGCYSHDNEADGFWAFVNPYSLLERCLAEDNGADGFSLDHTEDTYVKDFIARNNVAYGISLGGGGVGYGNKIENSLIEYNELGGMELYNAEAPITILNNTIRENLGPGINFSRSVGGNTIEVGGNLIENNTGYGIKIQSGCRGIKVFRNDFISNRDGSTQAYDSNTENSWEEQGGTYNWGDWTWEVSPYGNYWNDWTTPDSNSDGIVDNPYSLDGGVSQKDDYPLTSQVSSSTAHLLSNDLWEGGKFYVNLDGTSPDPPADDDDDPDVVDPPVDDDRDWVKVSGDYTMHDYYMWAHDSKDLAFHFNDGQTWGICTVEVDDAVPNRITGSSEYSYVPFYHPDDSRISYWEYEDRGSGWGNEGPNLYVMDSDGSNNTRITSSYTVRKHSYADDGNCLVYFSCEDNLNGWFELYRIHEDGTGNRRLASHGMSALMSVSPDGKKVAYDGRPYWNQIGSIYVIDVDGTDDHKAHDSVIHGTTTSDFTTMSWSGDGTRLVFTDNKDSDREIYTIKEDGSDLKKLTNNNYEDSIVNGDSYQVWNPVWDKIVFTSMEHGNWDVFVMDPDGSNKERITSSDSDETDALWSPDGRYISFMSDKGSNKSLYVVEYDPDVDEVDPPAGDDDVEPPVDDDDTEIEGTPDIEFKNEPYVEGGDQEVRVPEDFLSDNDGIEYEWYIEGYGFVGNGESIDLDLSEGTYNLTLVGKNSEDEVVFTVSREFQVRSALDEENDLLDILQENLITLIIAIIALILIIALFGFILSRKRKPAKDKDTSAEAPAMMHRQRAMRSPDIAHGPFTTTEEVISGKLERSASIDPYQNIGDDEFIPSTSNGIGYNEMKALNEAIETVRDDNIEGTSMGRSRAKLERKYREGALDKSEFDELNEVLNRYMK